MVGVLTDSANPSGTEGIFRIIQSIPSPKAEPFKLWLAKVAKELKGLKRENLQDHMTDDGFSEKTVLLNILVN